MPDAVLSTKDCAACDRFAVEKGLSSQQLMANAGRAVADAIRQRWSVRPVQVLCGPGNNGGDGFVIARQLAEAGWPVQVFLLGRAETLRGDAAWAAGQWSGAIEPAGLPALQEGALIVDALFGAGLNRSLEGQAAELIEAIRHAAGPVVAVDLPSGLSGDAQGAPGLHAPAQLTVTFHARKPAHVLEPHASACGEVVCADIGIPEGWQNVVTPAARLNAPALWHGALPKADAGDHKHAKGRLVVFSGGASSTGAARLSAEAGLRAGAGLVTLASPPSALLVNAQASTAVMVRRWPEPDGAGELLADLRATAAVIGPALGQGEVSRQAVASSAAAGIARVLDADALSSFAEDPSSLFSMLGSQDVLTPHEGEFRRLFPDIAESGRNKIERVCEAVRRAGCTVLLKGADTVIAAPGEMPIVNRHADPALATAGSGDVLAGLIGAWLARGVPPLLAACAAAWLHGEAGRHLGTGLTAEDLPAMLAERLQFLHRRQRQKAALSHLLTHKR